VGNDTPLVSVAASSDGGRVRRRRDPAEKAISEELRAMYERGETAKADREGGWDPEQFLGASPWMGAMRQGVDRPPARVYGGGPRRRRRARLVPALMRSEPDAPGKALTDHMLSGRRPDVLAPFRFDQ
jgi:hypothetical protein